MSSFPLKNMGGIDETSRILCIHINFPEMNGGISVYGGKSNNNKEGEIVVTNNTPKRKIIKKCGKKFSKAKVLRYLKVMIS